MNRRENLKALGLLTSHAMFPGVLSSFFSSCSSKEKIAEYQSEAFTEEELKTLKDLADLIVPATDTPGASDVGVPVFIEKYVVNCYTPDQQENFKKGLQSWQENMKMDADEKFATLREKEKESHQSDSLEAEFIRSLKNLTLLGYFFSENGAAAASYVSVPGTFQGCTDLQPGQYAELLNHMT